MLFLPKWRAEGSLPYRKLNFVKGYFSQENINKIVKLTKS